MAWAEKMVISCFQSESMYVLLGELAPFNSFEINELLAHIRSELALAEIRNRKEALEIVATAYVRRLFQNKDDSTNTLDVLRQLYADEGHPECLFDFYLLYYAKVEPEADGQQCHWPCAHRENINDVIHDYCQKWLVEHPLEEWREYEWRDLT